MRRSPHQHRPRERADIAAYATKREVLDEDDNCPGLRATTISDANENGIGDMCECGDQTGDGFVDIKDILAINAAIFDPSLATPLCDTNDDDECDVQDLLGANAKIFGAEAYCSRYPAP